MGQHQLTPEVLAHYWAMPAEWRLVFALIDDPWATDRTIAARARCSRRVLYKCPLVKVAKRLRDMRRQESADLLYQRFGLSRAPKVKRIPRGPRRIS